jgi:hypothetical protein
MERSRRKIILTGKRLELSQLTLDPFNSLENEYLFFDPVSLFNEIDWTSGLQEASTLNYIYGKIFDGFLMENKTLVCYWPTTDFPDSQWFSLLEFAKKAGIRMELNYFNEERSAQDEIPKELQSNWKELILELIESISNDLILNEGLAEIAQLKNTSSSITIFSQKDGDKLSYFYLTSAQEIFEFEPQYAFEKSENINYIPIFEDFENLLVAIQSDIDLTSYTVNFLDSKLEKVYFNSLMKKNVDVNLIQNWMDNYFLN